MAVVTGRKKRMLFLVKEKQMQTISFTKSGLKMVCVMFRSFARTDKYLSHLNALSGEHCKNQKKPQVWNAVKFPILKTLPTTHICNEI